MKRLYLISLIMGMVTGVWAERVDLSTARRVAEQVTIQSALRSVSNSTLKLAYEAPALSDNGLRSTTGETDYYVFNVGDGDGFVIVSGEDRAHPVLGYSTSGRFVADSLPSNAAAWLEGYQREIAHLVKMEAEAPASVREEWENYLAGSVRTNGGRLLKTAEWDQLAPYNWQTPVVDGQHTFTCCVATATAILLKYHKAPQKPLKTGSEEVMLRVGETNEGAVESGPYTVDYSGDYDWANMLDQYDGPYTKDQGDAVAKLMWHIGANLNVTYACDVSTAHSPRAEWVLREVFGCKAAHIEQKYFYSWEEWKTLLREEIDNDRPFLMSGSNSDAPIGHAFVCDGYDATGLFHINWGWGGSMNGYFQASTLDPYGGDVSNQFNDNHEMIIGIDPDNKAEVETGYEPAGCLNVEEEATQAEAPVVGRPYDLPVVIMNRSQQIMNETFGLALLDLETKELTHKPTNFVQKSIEPRGEDEAFSIEEMNLSITLSEAMTATEIIVPCYLNERSEWEVITPYYGEIFGVYGNGQYFMPDEAPNDPEVTYYPFFYQNAFDKKYLSKDTSELPVNIALRQVEGKWPTATIRYRLGEDALALLRNGWDLYGCIGPDGEYKHFLPTDSIEFVVTPEDYLGLNESLNMAVCQQGFKLVWPEEKGPKATGTFSYEVAIFDGNGQRLDDPGTLVGSVEMIDTPLSWDMTLSSQEEDPETERVISYDAIFTLLQADTALMDGSETDLFAYFTLDEGVSATITDENGKSHALIDEGNGRYRLDDWRVLLEGVSPIKLHVELTGNEAGQVIFPSLEMARHDGKLISVNMFAIDISYSDFEENYFPTIDSTDSEIRPDCDAELSLSSIAPIKDVLFRFVPDDPEIWLQDLLTGDKLVSLDADDQETSLKWDETTKSFTIGPDVYRMAYDELGWVEYTFPFRLKATQEGCYNFTLEVWDGQENIRVKSFENQNISVTYPVEVGQLKIPEGYVGTTDTLAFYLKNVGELLEDLHFTLSLQLSGGLPDKSVTLFNGTDSIPFTTCGERTIVTYLNGQFDTDSLSYVCPIRSSVPVQGGVYNPFVVYLVDEAGRTIPVDEENRLDIYFYEDYKFEIERDSAISIENASVPGIAATQDTFTVRSGTSVSLSMKVAEGYRLPSVPLLYEDSTLVNDFESGNYSYWADEEAYSSATLKIDNPRANYRLVMRAVDEETQCEVVSVDPTIAISDPILDKTNGFQTFKIDVAEGHELPAYVVVTAWRLKPVSTLRSATTLADDDRWEEIEMVYMRDYTYDPETGEVRVRVKNADKIVITPSNTEPEIPDEPEPTPDPEDPVYYTITLPQTEGATTEPDFGTHEVMAGDSFAFRIILDEDYDESAPIVRVNGELLEPNAKGEYVIASVEANTVITIEGIVKNDDTAIGSVETDVVRVWTASGLLHIQLPQPLPVRVVNYAGQVIRSWQAVEGDQTVSLPDGAYIVIVGDRHFKVVL